MVFDDTRDKINRILQRMDNGTTHCRVDTQFKGKGEKHIDDHRESIILQMHLIEEYTFRDIGEFFGLSVERVRQIEAKALRKFRHPSRSKYFKVYGDLSGDGGYSLTLGQMDEIHSRGLIQED